MKKTFTCANFIIILTLLTACQPTVNNYYLHPSMPNHTLAMAYPVYQSEVKCSITCFSYNGKNAFRVLPANPLPAGSKPIYVKGRVMVPGKYDANRICRPFGYETADISALTEFKDVCKVFIKTCREDKCWAGGN